MERYRLGDGKIDAFPFNKDEWNDTDGDGIGDNSDDDADGDGWTTEQENQTGNTTSRLDSGSSWTDGDGWLDGTELLCGSNPNDPQTLDISTRWRLRPHGRRRRR